jgi:hypothetical protein
VSYKGKRVIDTTGYQTRHSLNTVGAIGAMRYVPYGGVSKGTSVKEVKGLAHPPGHHAGLVFERWGGSNGHRDVHTKAQGRKDAKVADRFVKQCGYPNAPIYFAVDYDIKASDYKHVRAYFRGINSVIGAKRAGVYGGYWALYAIMESDLADFGWQTSAWSGGKVHPRAHLYQNVYNKRVNGAGADYNRVRKAGADYFGCVCCSPKTSIKAAGTTTRKGWPVDADNVRSGGKQKWRTLTHMDGSYPGAACGCLTHVVVLAEALLQERGQLKPGQKLQISQGSYSTSIAGSAGTHSGGGAADAHVVGYTKAGITEVVRALRQAGAPATWERKRGAKYGNFDIHHIHMVVAGCSHASKAAKRQLTKVKNGRDGLARNGPDYEPKVTYRTWRQAWSKYTKHSATASTEGDDDGMKWIGSSYNKKKQTLHKGKPHTLTSKKGKTKGGGRYLTIAHGHGITQELTVRGKITGLSQYGTLLVWAYYKEGKTVKRVLAHRVNGSPASQTQALNFTDAFVPSKGSRVRLRAEADEACKISHLKTNTKQ